MKSDRITLSDSIIGRIQPIGELDTVQFIESKHVIMSNFMLPSYIDLDYMNLCSFMGPFGFVYPLR